MAIHTGSLLKTTAFTLALLFGGTAMAKTLQEQNQVLIGQFAQQVFTEKDLSQIDTFITENYIQHNPLVAQGREGFYDFFKSWFESVPNFSYTLKNIIVNDEYVWVYGSYSGTPTKEWLGIPARGNTYEFNGVDIFRIEDGKLAEHWDVLDVYSLFKQLGTIK
jgi:predicted SnoaL-like aldol condensation-catalyzing enzyme